MRTPFIPLLLLASLSITAVPATAQAPGFSAQERQIGQEAHPQLLKEFGGAMQGKQADYVRNVGQKIASHSGMAARPQDYTVTLLNSSVNNAFALPGGYVYISRQLLALMNNEAELAFVMGHEVGHVAARHSQKRQQRAGLSGLGAAILGAVTGSNIVGQLANTGAQLYTLGFSREQERQADSLGLRYLQTAGYELQASGTTLAALGAQTALEARLAGKNANSTPGWLSTHPANAERVARIRREAEALARSTPSRSSATNRDAFLDMLDGLPYDDDSAQGIITGTRFQHPGFSLNFDAPQGFVLANSAEAVTGQRAITGGTARFQFTGGKPQGASLTDHAAKVWQALGVTRVPQSQTSRVNGIDMAISAVRTRSNNADVDATLAVYRWSNDLVFQLLMIQPAGRDAGFLSMVNSVRRLTAQEAAGIKGRRVSVVRVRAGDTVQSLADRMAYDDDRLSRFTILNGIDANSRLTPGTRVKIITRN